MVKCDAVISYPCHNRREYVELTAPQVINEKYNSKHKCLLYVGDDNSKDGTWEYLNTLAGIDKLEQRVVGNSIWQLNEAFKLAKERGAKYVIAMANDILPADGHIDKMIELMEANPKACSIMIEECFNLPYIKDDLEVKEYPFTSSLGIHRADLYPHNMAANKRFFGFQEYQNRLYKEGYTCLRVSGMGNTNLDGSAWSRQEDYYRKGYARKGLVANDKTVYKTELNNG